MTKKILLVDDEKDQVYVIQKAFEKLFSNEYHIISAYSGKECISILEKSTPDIIILDLMMPEMNGWEVFDKIKAHNMWKTVPIIILTARTDGFAEHAAGSIADDFIKKPVDVTELKSRIDHLLRKKKRINLQS
ncbi:MAG: response regulator [Thermoplasmata archaeon]|nr:MAG: response regulator [Thermoplasmata archaeon]